MRYIHSTTKSQGRKRLRKYVNFGELEGVGPQPREQEVKEISKILRTEKIGLILPRSCPACALSPPPRSLLSFTQSPFKHRKKSPSVKGQVVCCRQSKICADDD